MKTNQISLKQEQLTKKINQFAHDVLSPTNSISLVINNCKMLLSEQKSIINDELDKIRNMAFMLLTDYENMHPKEKEAQQVLLSLNILQMLSSKRYEFYNYKTNFKYEFTGDSIFAFIKGKNSYFQRMLSNLINNAVEAYQNNAGTVTVKLRSDEALVEMIIEDNGKGMSSELIDKIMNNISFTQGKENGHGIGMSQIYDTIKYSKGILRIDSKLEEGTKMILTFPKDIAPIWVTSHIQIMKSGIIVILDDDPNIHEVWDAKFRLLLTQLPDLKIRHFELGSEVINYIKNLTIEEKQRVCLLIDYELLSQNLNGLQIMEKIQIKNTILVTHYHTKALTDIFISSDIKILPKLLVELIPIRIGRDN